MSAHELMKDPYYGQLMLCIESTILHADQDAQRRGIRLTDSNVKSALNKARTFKPNPEATPHPDPKTKDDVIAILIPSLAGLHTILESKGDDGDTLPVSEADIKKALTAVEASLKLRKSPEPGSRYYLDYLEDFLKRAKSC